MDNLYQMLAQVALIAEQMLADERRRILADLNSDFDQVLEMSMRAIDPPSSSAPTKSDISPTQDTSW